MKKNESFLHRFGAIYIFVLIVAYISSSVYNNLGGNYIADILRNNLHFAVATEEDSGHVNTICSIKNTGYSTAKDVKILIWSMQPGFSNTEFESDALDMISKEGKISFIHTVFKMKNDVYPGETKTVRFVFKKGLQAEDVGFEMGKSDTLRVKVYSSNTPAIEVLNITEKTKFAIGPYLFDLLWVVGWTYVDIGLFIVLPLALIIFLIFSLLNKLLNPRLSL
jgi:hypothetical protein